MKKVLPCVVLLAAVSVVGAAQTLSVSYVEGQVQVKAGAAWRDLAIGDEVAPDAIVRIGAQGLAQLGGAGTSVTFARAGTYALKDVLAARAAAVGRGGSAIAGALKRLVVGGPGSASAVLGVRAYDARRSGGLWIENPWDGAVAVGKDALAEGRFDDALTAFREALAESGSEDPPEIHFYLGWTLWLRGDTAGAWKQAARAAFTPGADWAPDYILLRARLLEDTGAFADAADWLTVHDLSRDTGRAQLYWLLLGVGWRGAGEPDKAEPALRKAAGMAPDSDLGAAAAQLLGG